MTDKDAYLKWCVDMGLTPKASGMHVWQAAIAHAQQESKPVAVVSEVHMSRYTLEWLDAPLPEGTLLYKAAP